MAIQDRAIAIFLTIAVSLLMLYADRGSRILTEIAENAKEDSCVTGLDPLVRRSLSYSENGRAFKSKDCSRASATWEYAGGRLTLQSVQALEPVSWLPNDLNIYRPASDLVRRAGKPNKIDKGGRMDFYYYETPNRASVIFQVSSTNNVIASVTVEYQ